MTRERPTNDPISWPRAKRSTPTTRAPRRASTATVALPCVPRPTTMTSYTFRTLDPERSCYQSRRHLRIEVGRLRGQPLPRVRDLLERHRVDGADEDRARTRLRRGDRAIRVVLVHDRPARGPRGLDEEGLGLRDRQRAPRLRDVREIDVRPGLKPGEHAVAHEDDAGLRVRETALVDGGRLERARDRLVERGVRAADDAVGRQDAQARIVERAEVREHVVRRVLREVDPLRLVLFLQVLEPDLVAVMAVGQVDPRVPQRSRQPLGELAVLERPQEMTLIPDARLGDEPRRTPRHPLFEHVRDLRPRVLEEPA